MKLSNRYIFLAYVLCAFCQQESPSAADRASSLKVRALKGTVSIGQVASPPATTALVQRHISKTTPITLAAGVNAVGDNASDPFIIGSLPFSSSGNTSTYIDDYHEQCPLPLGGARDVVYRYTPPVDQVVTVDLCGSSFDTKVYVYQNAVTPGSPIDCNDDYCGTTNTRSYLPAVSMTAGVPYFIVVDGYGVSSGSYTIDIALGQACVWTGCEQGAIAEGENCVVATDITNPGCSQSGQFTTLTVDQTRCGTIWADYDGVEPDRDTDWYRASLSAGSVHTVTTRAEFPFSVYVFDVTQGCLGIQGPRFDGHACEELTLELETLEAGDYAFVVTTRDQFDGFECATGPWEYTIALAPACVCICHGNPNEPPDNPGTCDGAMDILDVTTVVGLAFRNQPSIPDPSPTCPFVRADGNCDSNVDILDVVLMVDVAFRNGNPLVVFCNPCAIP